MLPIWSMCEIPVKQGFLLATGSGDETVRLWNPRTGDLVHAMVINFIKVAQKLRGKYMPCA